jgi:hypothetical protein
MGPHYTILPMSPHSRNIDRIKFASIPVILLLLLGGLPSAVHASATVGYSNQGGLNSGAAHGNTAVSIRVQTSSGTEIVLVWVLAGGNDTDVSPISISDNESNTWTLSTYGGALTTQCAYTMTQCVYGTTWSNPVTYVGHDFITITFPNHGYIIALSVYDVITGALTYNTHSTGNSNLGSTSNLAVGSYTPTAGALVLTEAYIALESPSNSFSAGAGYSLAEGQGTWPSGTWWATSETRIASGATTSPETSTSNYGWFEVSIALTGAAGVTQAVTVNVAPLAPSNVFFISGCAVTNSSFDADGYAHTYNGLAPSCALTITAPTFSSPYYRYEFSNGGRPVSIWVVTTAASGTGSPATNTTYYQVLDSVDMFPSTPSTWDGTYSKNVTGVSLGIHGVTLATETLISGAAGSPLNWIWSDYGQLINFPATFASTNVCGGTWTAIAPYYFTPLAGDHAYAVHYNLDGASCTASSTSTAGPSTVTSTLQAQNFPTLSVVTGVIVMIMFVFIMPAIVVQLASQFAPAQSLGDVVVTLWLLTAFMGALLGSLSSTYFNLITPGYVPWGLTVFLAASLIVWAIKGGGQ